jgi:hypothetical protein
VGLGAGALVYLLSKGNIAVGLLGSDTGTRLTLFSDDKPDRFFTVMKFWMDDGLSVPLKLSSGVPCYQVEDEEGRIHLLIHLPIEAGEHRWCLWRPDHAGFDSRSIFEGALVNDL